MYIYIIICIVYSFIILLTIIYLKIIINKNNIIKSYFTQVFTSVSVIILVFVIKMFLYCLVYTIAECTAL